jgi:uncharacterized protein YndB with AHSA1/START domain
LYFLQVIIMDSKKGEIMATIKLNKLIKAPPSEVYLYFTNSTALRDWFCDGATADPHVGGRLYIWWNGGYYTSGEYIKLEKDEFVSFSWFGRNEPRSTTVDVKLIKRKVGTLLKLTHRNIGRGAKWASIAQEYEKEWKNKLDNLASVLGSGEDLRITTRPMLGVFTDEFNADIAKKLGIPVEQGMRISGVVDGLGAQKAGFIGGDVVVGMDAQEITGGESFRAFITDKKAGDNVKVTFYRGAEKRTIQMTLSGRPIPHIPTSGSELARQVEPIYRHNESEIEALLNAASEDECSQKPAPLEWSVKEVLAHLIHGERGWQNFLTEIIGGYEGAYDGFGGNILAYIDAIVATYPSKTALFNQLKNLNAETLNFLTLIPSDFLKHRGKFWKLAFLANENSYHLQTHLEQMRSAIQFARNS